MSKTSTNPNSRDDNDSLLLRALHGRLLSMDFFTHNWIKLLMLIAMILIYITNKYQCQTRMEEIRRLSQQLEVIETERVRVRSEYMSRIRESSMQQLVDTMHLGLHIQDRPPYHLPQNK